MKAVMRGICFIVLIIMATITILPIILLVLEATMAEPETDSFLYKMFEAVDNTPKS